MQLQKWIGVGRIKHGARAMQADVRVAMTRLGPGAADFAPTSGGAALSGPKPVTAVTKSAIPIGTFFPLGLQTLIIAHAIAREA